MRQFDTGATRDSDTGKLDYEGFLSPLVLERYAEYMHQCRKLPSGALRDADNWQSGIPATAYMKSMWRHFMDVWKLHRSVPITTKDRFTGEVVDIEVALCAVMFNAMGMLHEVLRRKERSDDSTTNHTGAPAPAG